jgi:hypothetical protein
MLGMKQIIPIFISFEGNKQKGCTPILQQRMVSQEKVFTHLLPHLDFQRTTTKQNSKLPENNG